MRKPAPQHAPLHDATHGEVGYEGEPQGVVDRHGMRLRQRREHGNGKDGEEGGSRDESGNEHAARHGHADEYAVVNERGKTSERYEPRPRAKRACRSHHSAVVGEQPQQHAAAKGVCQREEQGYGQAPVAPEGAHKATQPHAVASAIILSRQRLAGKGEAVHDVAEYGVKGHEQRVHGKRHVALARACRGEGEAH